jgi:hypothetical protein
MSHLESIRNWYGRYERPLSSFSLVLGFVFDVLTLKRVDMFWENLWIVGHLLIVGTFIILIHLQEKEAGDEKNPGKAHFWYVNILQFFFGGILSTYLIFYFRSADILVTWPFIFLLALAFMANESLKRHYVRFSFQVSLFFLSLYSFMIFLVPILFHQISPWIFILSGLLSLVLIGLFIKLVFHFTQERFTENKKIILFLILGIFAAVNFLYFTNLIPPIPLSLKEAGVYHSLQKNPAGNYEVTFEDTGWWNYFKMYPDFKKTQSAAVYAYSAIFSPKGLNLNILHEWQHYDELQKKWLTQSVITLPVLGGRDGGFRTYSLSSNLTAGKWRVKIETEQKQTIGTLRFNIISSDFEPVLTAGVKE